MIEPPEWVTLWKFRFGTKQPAKGWRFESFEEKTITTQPLPQDNSNPSNLPQPGQSPEIPDIPPATVPEQQPDSLPEPLGPDIPDRPEPTPDVPVPEHSPEIPGNPSGYRPRAAARQSTRTAGT
ncbi:hypothetical protein [Brucella pituitosa]|uniref:hypothetical protein n=1 Tax=Brucella pituitosa TaxID=571256 RepID=UPI000FE25A5D|nr:hypothetical protein [Brucella pituitosa]